MDVEIKVFQAPDVRDTLLVRGILYRVDDFDSDGYGVFTILLKRDTAVMEEVS